MRLTIEAIFLTHSNWHVKSIKLQWCIIEVLGKENFS